MKSEGGNIGEVAKRTNEFVTISLSLLYLIHTLVKIQLTQKKKLSALTSQMFLLNFIHSYEKKKGYSFYYRKIMHQLEEVND